MLKTKNRNNEAFCFSIDTSVLRKMKIIPFHCHARVDFGQTKSFIKKVGGHYSIPNKQNNLKL